MSKPTFNSVPDESIVDGLAACICCDEPDSDKYRAEVRYWLEMLIVNLRGERGGGMKGSRELAERDALEQNANDAWAALSQVEGLNLQQSLAGAIFDLVQMLRKSRGGHLDDV